MCFRGVIVCEKLDSPAENRVRAYIASLHRLMLAAREVLFLARVLLLSFGRVARKHDSHWRVGFYLKLFFPPQITRGADVATRGATACDETLDARCASCSLP